MASSDYTSTSEALTAIMPNLGLALRLPYSDSFYSVINFYSLQSEYKGGITPTTIEQLSAATQHFMGAGLKRILNNSWGNFSIQVVAGPVFSSTFRSVLTDLKNPSAKTREDENSTISFDIGGTAAYVSPERQVRVLASTFSNFYVPAQLNLGIDIPGIIEQPVMLELYGMHRKIFMTDKDGNRSGNNQRVAAETTLPLLPLPAIDGDYIGLTSRITYDRSRFETPEHGVYGQIGIIVHVFAFQVKANFGVFETDDTRDNRFALAASTAIGLPEQFGSPAFSVGMDTINMDLILGW